MTESNPTQPQQSFNILLIGDDCIDVYQYGNVDRISPEAPVPVFESVSEESRPGMAANVLANLVALGCTVNYLHGATSVKTRLIDLRSRQQVLRIDNDNYSEALEIETAIPKGYHAIVISDYNKGTVSHELIEQLRQDFDGPIFVDTKKSELESCKGCIVKINNLEYHRLTSECSDLIVTLGKDGARYKNTIYPAPRIEIADVTGAGDTFLSAVCYEYLRSNGNMDQAIEFAIRASSITVQHVGVYAPTLEEISCV
jgi:D-beta-D-heptose 7-phosphate kinase/D-beta-D-heptose 1-phosphate adenosyltransferase